MKNLKKIYIFAIIMILLGLFFIISIFVHSNNNSSPSWDNVHLYIKKNTLTVNEATIICKNKNKLKYDCYFYDKFFIDKKIGDSWSELPILESYIILSEYITFGDKTGAPYVYESTINWASKYGSLSTGETYRLRFEPTYYNNKENIEDSGILTVEFKL